MLNFLFPAKPCTERNSWLLLAARVVFGAMLLTHGIAKWSAFDALSDTFPDPLNMGSRMSLMLAIFAEVFCAGCFIVGLLYRLVLLPMIFTMGVAFFIVHKGDPLAARELALTYLVVYVLLYIAGPGRFALDTVISRRIPRKFR